MKKTFALIILLFCICVSMKAQEQKKKSSNEIDISYYNTPIGQNIAAEYNRNFGNHTLVIGIKYHLNHHVGITEGLSNNDVYYTNISTPGSFRIMSALPSATNTT